MASKIFIADDNEDYVLLFRQALNRINSGHQCMSAENGYQALSQLKFMLPSVPDFIFVDVKMPIMNGHEIVMEFKKYPALSKVPVIMYSAVEQPDDRQKAEEAGVMHYYAKPYQAEDLNRLLINVLNSEMNIR